MSSIPAIVAGVSTDVSRLKSATNLKAAGEKFEAVFDGLMLKSMRQAKLADPLFGSKALDTFTDMQDTQLAQSMAQHHPIGIGKALTDFIGKGIASVEHNLNQSASDPPK